MFEFDLDKFTKVTRGVAPRNKCPIDYVVEELKKSKERRIPIWDHETMARILNGSLKKSISVLRGYIEFFWPGTDDHLFFERVDDGQYLMVNLSIDGFNYAWNNFTSDVYEVPLMYISSEKVSPAMTPIIVPQDKCPLDVIAEMGEASKSAWFFIGLETAIQLCQDSDEGEYIPNGIIRCFWRGSPSTTATEVIIERFADKIWAIKAIYANDISFSKPVDVPTNIYFLTKEK